MPPEPAVPTAAMTASSALTVPVSRTTVWPAGEAGDAGDLDVGVADRGGRGERRRRGRWRRAVAQDDRAVVLEDGVRDTHVAYVATRAGERYPGRGRVAREPGAAQRGRVAIDHVEVVVGRGDGGIVRRVATVGRVGPVLERGREAARPISPEVVVRVRDRLAVPVGIETGQRAQDPATRMRDQDRVVVRQQCPVALDEVEQVRHLLEVGRDVRVVTQEVRVVELDVDDVLDLVVLRLEVAGSGGDDRAGRSGAGRRDAERGGDEDRRGHGDRYPLQPMGTKDGVPPMHIDSFLSGRHGARSGRIHWDREGSPTTRGGHTGPHQTTLDCGRYHRVFSR